jgi:hypothetical protein
MTVVVLAIVASLFLWIGFLPTIIAIRRGAPFWNCVGLLIINIMCAPTVLGWFFLLAHVLSTIPSKKEQAQLREAVSKLSEEERARLLLLSRLQ